MKTGFTLIELIMVLAVISIIAAASVPVYRGIQNEASYYRASADLQILKGAVESYYRHNRQWPADITDALIKTSPRVINTVLSDDFYTVVYGTGYTYGYEVVDNTYYVIYSQAFNRKKDWSWADGAVVNSGDDFIATNARLLSGTHEKR